MTALQLASCFDVFIAHHTVYDAYGNAILSTALNSAICFNLLITHCHVYDAHGNEILLTLEREREGKNSVQHDGAEVGGLF